MKKAKNIGSIAKYMLLGVLLILTFAMAFFLLKYAKGPGEEPAGFEPAPFGEAGNPLYPPWNPPEQTPTPTPPSTGDKDNHVPPRSETGQKSPLGRYVYKVTGDTSDLSAIDAAFGIVKRELPAQASYFVEQYKGQSGYDYVIEIGSKGTYVIGNTIYVKKGEGARKIAHEIFHTLGIPDVHKTIASARSHNPNMKAWHILIPVGGETPGLMYNLKANGLCATSKIFYWKRDLFKRAVVDLQTGSVKDWHLLLKENEAIVYYIYDEDLQGFLQNKDSWTTPKTAEEILSSAIKQSVIQSLLTLNNTIKLDIVGAHPYLVFAILLLLLWVLWRRKK